MRKFVAMMVAVTMMVGAGVAQKAKSAESVSKAAVAPALTDTGTMNYIPVFTDASGDLGNSGMYQLNGGTVANPEWWEGIGTTAPAFNLNVVSSDPADQQAAIAIDGYGTVGINFIGRRAEGTLASPAALAANDNIFAMQGRGWFSGPQPGFSQYSRAFMKFFAAENWTNLAQGTYISLATTIAGTAPAAPAVERMRIAGNGFVGIGTGAPGTPLEVNGSITMTNSSGGSLIFQNGTQQTTAAYNLTPANNTVTISGTTAPTIAVNTSVVQPILNGATTCPAGSAMTSVNPATGAVQCSSVGPGGSLASVPVVVANTSFTGGYGLGTAQTIYTATTTGFYRVSVYMNTPTTGTCASAPCAGEAIAVQWNDGVSTTALATANCSLVTACGSSVVTPIWVLSGQVISAYGQSYGTGSAPTGSPSYTAYVLVEHM